MKKYQCNKCESKEMFIMQKGCQMVLYCSDCGAWQKWLSKKRDTISRKLYQII